MKLLLIGGGGREHALAWKLSQSAHVDQLFVAPGNAGTAQTPRTQNVPIAADQLEALAAFAQEQAIDLTLVGPEAPLVAGIVDRFQTAGLRIFGPSRAAAQLEGSKAFSKAFMQRHAIPTAEAHIFSQFDEALAYLHTLSQPPVIKASGLAAGKGVTLPANLAEAEATLRQMLSERLFGEANDTVLIEERLSGPELSVLAFCDGRSLRVMPAAQDHKRLLDGDQGPNTGGMGAFAPSPVASAALLAQVEREILRPTLAGMAAEGTPYAGVLYAGLMLTPAGPKTLEFNCRLGDPETQVILPLLQSDLVEIILACVEGRLDTLEIDWRSGCAATVVMAAGGYPGAYTKSQPITGLAAAEAAGATVFHAGTRLVNGQTVSDGGRVLAVTALGDDLAGAAQRAYRGVEQIHFEGAQWRSDIARRAPLSDAADRGVDHYRSAGVDIDAGNRAVNLMKAAVRSTFTPAVLADVGSFGGLFALEQLPAQPVLVASTDGVGTKVKLAAQLGRWRGVGHDLVNHCVNDILVQNARPLFFLDYVATAKLQPEVVAEIVGGMAEACRAVGCALLGGETAEMPGVYSEGAYDVAGTIIGLVDRSQIWPRSVAMQAGDRLVGLPSSGPHTNGYSLIRRLIDGCDLAQPLAPGQPPLGDALLRPHRCYLAEVERMQQAGIAIKGMAHITGGGFHDNIPRVLPATLSAQINLQNWTVPPLFAWLQARSGMDRRQALRVFNMGIGMVLIVSPEQTLPLFSLLPEAVTIGVLAPRGSGEAVVFG